MGREETRINSCSWNLKDVSKKVAINIFGVSGNNNNILIAFKCQEAK